MGNKKERKKKKASKAPSDGLMVDPCRVRFQHARIRPYFSGCGRSVTETLDSIREGVLSPSDLPPIQVIVGPESEDGPWYFSLNNRRLWVLKRCREEGLLPNNKIYVRVRKPKSEQESARYSLQNCALEAKIMFEKQTKSTVSAESNKKPENGIDIEISPKIEKLKIEPLPKQDKEVISSDEESDDSSDGVGLSNRFSALF